MASNAYIKGGCNLMNVTKAQALDLLRRAREYDGIQEALGYAMIDYLVQKLEGNGEPGSTFYSDIENNGGDLVDEFEAQMQILFKKMAVQAGAEMIGKLHRVTQTCTVHIAVVADSKADAFNLMFEEDPAPWDSGRKAIIGFSDYDETQVQND